MDGFKEFHLRTKKMKERFWGPISEILEAVQKHCESKNYTDILEIGPGIIPFPKATRFVGYNESIPNYISVDIDEEPLPFQDKELDFVYSRHTMEDIQNPNFAMREILRCSKGCFIETPSPLVEITKGVDCATPDPDKYGGYIHHRYIVWSDNEKQEIYFLPKNNFLVDTYIHIPDAINKKLESPFYWNNYFLCDGSKPVKIIMYKNGVNIGVKDHFCIEYLKKVQEAVNKSIENTDSFISRFLF